MTSTRETSVGEAPAASEAGTRSPLTLLLAAGGVATVVGVAWVGLSLATGLLYHLMPGAMFAGTAWVFHELGRRRATRIEGLILMGFAALITAAASLVISSEGGTVGSVAETVIVVAVGLALAVRWLVRD